TPDSPGVYFFLDKKGKILYIGKATSLKNRVRSYFTSDILEKRGPLIAQMVKKTKEVKFQKTDSVLEALIIEANLIKKHNPPYNSAEKDQKSWNYVVFTQEEFPRVLTIRERELASLPPLIKGRSRQSPSGVLQKFGPFTNSGELKEVLKIIRKIFPFRDKCNPSPSQGEGKGVGSRGCFNYQIGLCPGVCLGAISKNDYFHILKNIRMIFEGKKPKLIKSLKKEMAVFAKNREFEKANQIKKKTFTLQHIQDIALLKNPKFKARNPKFRVEAYDVSHISGTNVVGVTVVIENGELKKNDYRKFKIKIQKNDDVGALREVLERRLKHHEWPYPDLIVVDGGEAQINVAKAELEKKGLNIRVIAVVKNEKHKPQKIIGTYSVDTKKDILLANSEAHRFAIRYHRHLRSQKML
ncbi:MAG: GIY-YIG nuclease family protein, partial [Patescibacteria group bacterium]